MSAYTARLAADRWIPRVAAGFTGAMAGLAVNAALDARWGYALAWFFATLCAANWWVTARRLLGAREERDRQQAAFVALVEKVAIDQSRDYYERIVPVGILAAADLPAYVYPDDAERAGESRG